jgi:hypothetical protein
MVALELLTGQVDRFPLYRNQFPLDILGINPARRKNFESVLDLSDMGPGAIVVLQAAVVG